jgi:hypothetical protein
LLELLLREKQGLMVAERRKGARFAAARSMAAIMAAITAQAGLDISQNQARFAGSTGKP